ncbi:SCO7613 C-terminal domain-containing membrane protein [Cellulomonas denverensis]|uniref:Uncharacterized protein n=1 Tax=Cellulomonas denverensis TaxID=264297 RepID=A0A7X6QY32_9CELL|nr:hypothetical protein [Cellulomonas denverensis]NKY21757.1 hypothetical protein [Cellulomonas denverensis]
MSAIFALAGSAMFAVAALVFGFFLVADSPFLRAGVLVLSTGMSAAGTWLLLRRGLRSSAQAVAWLTAALALVDCWVLALLVHGHARPVVAALGVAAVVAGGVLAGRRTGLRAWASLVVVLPVVPLLLGAATGDVTGLVVGIALAAATTLVRRPFRERVASSVGVRTQAESMVLVAWTVPLLGLLPLFVTGAVSRFDPGSTVSDGVPVLVFVGLGLGLAVTAVLTAVQAWSEGGRFWLGMGGFLLVGAAAAFAAAAPTGALVPVAASVVWLALVSAGGRWRNGPLHRAAVLGGAVAVLVSAVSVLESTVAVAVLVEQTAAARVPELLPIGVFDGDQAGPWRALVAAGCLLGLSLLTERLRLPDRVARVVMPPATPMSPPQFRREPRPAWERTVGRVLAPVSVLVVAGMLPVLLRPWSGALLAGELLVAVALVEAARRVPRPGPWFSILLTGAVGQLALLAILGWVSRPTALIAGLVIPVLALRLRRLTSPDLRWVPVLVAVIWPSLVAAVALTWLEWSAPTIAGVLAVVLVALMLALTPARRVDTGSWLAVLVVAAVPVTVACATTLADRSWAAGWTAAALAIAEAVLLATRTRPVPGELRVLTAAALLPTLVVAAVNAGAMLLPGSASPVLLPVLAVLSAVVAVGAPGMGGLLARRGIASARIALEWSALGTGAAILVVAWAWPTTGADTVLVVTAVLAAGASAVAARSDRRPVWWVAAALWSGVLWTALAWGGIGLVEAYTVPPALAAVLVGGWLTRRRPERWWPLAASGLALLVVPTLVLLLAGREIDIRATVLLAGAAVLAGLAFWLGRPRLRPVFGALTDPLAWAAGAAALAGPVRAVWLAVDTPWATEARNAAVFGAALGWAVIGAALLALAGLLLTARRAAAWRPWSSAPALAAFTIAGLSAVRPTWTVVWVALALELAALALTVLAVRPGGRLVLPPAWFGWLIAVAWAIGGWSLRELRVEVYALPLGLGLTLAGLLALRAGDDRPGPRAWPVGFRGSMATLAPGVAATLGPSLLAIWTDPVTWRAILVVALSLVFMVAGARELLRAPLVIGSVTLGLAVLSVFGTQLGSAISAGPWLLTLLSAGGLLLVLGIYAERRKPAEGEARPVLR